MDAQWGAASLLESANDVDRSAIVKVVSASVPRRRAALGQGSARCLLEQAKQVPARVSELAKSANRLLGVATVLLEGVFHRNRSALDGAFPAIDRLGSASR
jgi:hypothetical protein